MLVKPVLVRITLVAEDTVSIECHVSEQTLAEMRVISRLLEEQRVPDAPYAPILSIVRVL